MGIDKREQCVLAEFASAKSLYDACKRVRDEGFKKWDAYSPFPVHGLDRAMGQKTSRLPWVVLFLALSGAASGMLLEWWVSVKAYPLIISGKPLFSWPAFVPVMFELGILGGALGCLFGLLGFCQLPKYNFPAFESTRFEKVTDDKFFIMIESSDLKFDTEKTKNFLQGLGSSNVEVLG